MLNQKFEDSPQRESSDAKHTNKRRRLMMPPDGFHTPTRKPHQTAPTPNFTSAFDSDPQTTASSSSKANAGSRSEKRLLKPPLLTTLPSDTINLNTPPKKRIRMSDLKPITHDNHGVSNLRRIPIPQPQPISPSSRKKTTPLKSLPPPFPTSSSSTHRTSPSMKPISSTLVARAIDLTTQHGNAELLSVFLQHHGVDHVSPTDRELHRGLLASPEKGKGRPGNTKSGLKFIRYLLFFLYRVRLRPTVLCRGGLAERADHLLSRTHTALSLWRREMETEGGDLPRTRPKFKSAPDLRLSIIRIIHHTSSRQPRSGGPGQGIVIAICRLIHPGFKPDEIMSVLLNLSSPAPAKEGSELYLWRPWYEVEVGVGANANVSVGIDVDVDVGTNDVGLPKSGCVNFTGSLLLCSRFLILPSPSPPT